MKDVPKGKRFTIGWYNEGIAHIKTKDYEEALSFMERALEYVPDHPDFLVGKGDVLFAMERYDEAFESYRQAVSEEPHNRKAWLKAGLTLMKLGKYGDALVIFDFLLKEERHDGEIWLGRGIALLNLGRKEEAVESLRNARRLQPDQPLLWHALASLEGDNREAIRLLERGYRIDPTNLEILLAIAERHLAMGLKEDALRWCGEAIALYPNNPRAKEILERCRAIESR